MRSKLLAISAIGLSQRKVDKTGNLMTRFLTILLAGLLLLGFNTPQSHAVTYPTLVGHRGVGDPWTVKLSIPEQSIPAIQWAAAHHADVVEGDVRVSGPDSSGHRVLYMMHDDTLDRTTNGTGGSYTQPWSYISQRWLEIPVDRNGNGDPDNTSYHPPSFVKWLAAAKATRKLVYVELKGEGWTKSLVKQYVDAVTAQGMKTRVITSGGETKLSYFRSYSSGARAWSAGHYPSASKVKSVASYATISLAGAEAKPDYVRMLQAEGIKVFIWTLDNSGHYARALPFGAYGWMCDNTQDAWVWLEAHGA